MATPASGMSGMSPTVSIIMPCYNAATHLATSLGSVYAQRFGDWELIAVDDGSHDDTFARLQAQTDPRVRAFTQPNRGVSAARNAGLASARGRYVAFLDADDRWAPGFLAALVAALEARPDAALAYCGWQNVGLPGARGEPFVPPDYETPDKAETLFTGCRWPIHAALVRSDAVRIAGGFDPRLKNAEDYALWLRIATTDVIVRVPEVLAYYHFHGQGQASAQAARAALQQWQAQRDFLTAHPDFAARLGHRRARALMLGEMLKRAYACYWQRDLDDARTLFRAVMTRGYGTLRDWKYMLPAWLPASWHRRLIGLRDRHS